MKKVFALLTVLALSVAMLAGCGGSTSSAPAASAPAGSTPVSTPADGSTPAPSGNVPKIGVVTPDADHGFTGESVAHARAELEKLQAEGLIEYRMGVGGEAAKQISEIEAILQWGPDVIVLWPLEGDQLRNAATQIMDAGVKLVVYDRLIEGFEPTAEVMGDNETIGKMMGEYVLNYFSEELAADEEISYLRFIGDSSTVSIQRSGGMDGVIADSEYADKFTQIQSDYQTDWSNAKAQEQMENWLNTASPADIEALDMIVTHDDEIVDGLVVALDNYEASNPGVLNIKLITSVGARRETLATFDNEVAGGIDLVTYFFSPSMVRDAIRIGVAAANGEQYDGREVSGMFLLPTVEVDKDTVEEFRASEAYEERYSI